MSSLEAIRDRHRQRLSLGKPEGAAEAQYRHDVAALIRIIDDERQEGIIIDAHRDEELLAISNRLNAISQQRYANRNTVTPDNAFEEFRDQNKHVCEIYDEAERLAARIGDLIAPAASSFSSKVANAETFIRPLFESPTIDAGAANRTAADVLADAAATFRERQKVYGNNYKLVGAALAAFFPDGVTLRTAEDFNRWHLFELVMIKLSRFSVSMLTHTDSIHDAAVYCAMVESLTSPTPIKKGNE